MAAARRGKGEEPKVNLPDGWWQRLLRHYRQTLKASDPFNDVFKAYGLDKRTFDRAKRSGTMTERSFARLMERGRLDDDEDLLHFFDQGEPDLDVGRFRVDLSRIAKYAPSELIGRDEFLDSLDVAWSTKCDENAPRTNIVVIVAEPGEGKSSVVAKWTARLAHRNWPNVDCVFAWSFHNQGTRGEQIDSSDLFLSEALRFFGDPAMALSRSNAWDKGQRLANLVGSLRAVLVLDALELLQQPPSRLTPGKLIDQGMTALLNGLAAYNRGLCVITTQYSIPDLWAFWQTTVSEKQLPRLSRDAIHELVFFMLFDRLTPEEKRYIRAMAELGAGPHRTGAIAEVLKRPVSSLAPVRANLIRLGMIRGPSHGDTAFTVPLYEVFVQRVMPGDSWRAD